MSARWQASTLRRKPRAARKVRQSRPEWRQSQLQALARHVDRNPEQAATVRAVQAALKRGQLAKAEHCQALGCTSRKAIEAHHWSYAPEHRLDVLWVFAAHHRQ